MKKIFLFIIFIPLVLISIYLGFSQQKNMMNTKNEVDTPSVIVVAISPTPTIQISNQINLILSSPAADTVINNSSILVSGTTGINVNVIVNDKELTSKNDGTFSVLVNLDEGENYISVVAYNDSGEIAERELLVTRTVSNL